MGLQFARLVSVEVAWDGERQKVGLVELCIVVLVSVGVELVGVGLVVGVGFGEVGLFAAEFEAGGCCVAFAGEVEIAGSFVIFDYD